MQIFAISKKFKVTSDVYNILYDCVGLKYFLLLSNSKLANLIQTEISFQYGTTFI